MAKYKQEQAAYIERLDSLKAGMRWADGSLVYRADGSLDADASAASAGGTGEEDSEEQPDMD